MIDDIEDNYPDYLDDERGYAWDAWDVLSADLIRRHDAIVNADAAQLQELDPAGLDDLDRWAFARASRAQGDSDGFLEAARLVLTSSDAHRGISYVDVFVTAIEAMADAGLGDEAELHLRTFRERWPEDRRALRLHVYVAARTGDLEGALADARTEAADDPETIYEIAEDLAGVDPTAAAELLDWVVGVATGQNLRALLLDIELLRERLIG